MTKLHIISDLHLEFGYYNIPEFPDESSMVLILAGDVGVAAKPSTFMPFIREVSTRFAEVIWVPGNHEHYSGSIKRSAGKILREFEHEDIHNVHVANNRTIRRYDVSFVCSTMWSSFDKGNPVTMYEAEFKMNDYKLIRTGKGNPYQKKFKPMDAYQEFLESINFIFPEIEKEKAAGQKVVVITHMAPSSLSVPEIYKGDRLNGAYVSNLEEDIFDAQPNLWIHGHLHSNSDYLLEDTRIICNPRGYWSEMGEDLNPGFQPNLVIEI